VRGCTEVPYRTVGHQLAASVLVTSRNPGELLAFDRLLLELRGCFIQGGLHRRPCRVHPGLHVLPRRFTGRAHFLQFLVRGVAIGAHCLELLVVFVPRVGAHLGARGSQLIDLSIPFLDLLFHHCEVFILLAHGETPLSART
jgi:hypothetical protein